MRYLLAFVIYVRWDSVSPRLLKAASICGLGEGIRDYPTYCPTTLRDRSMIGVCTSTLPNGADPFTRVRVPEVTEQAASARAMETVSYRTDPVQLVGQKVAA